MAKRGRKTIFDETIAGVITRSVERGNYIETAAAAAGIHKDTLYDWLKRGAIAKRKKGGPSEAEQPLADFSDAVQRALAIAEQNDLDAITEAGRGYDAEKTIEIYELIPSVDDKGKPILDAAGAPVMTRKLAEVKTETKHVRSWQAAAWRLERRNPGMYGRRVAMEVSTPDGLPVFQQNQTVNINELDTDELTRQIMSALGRGGTGGA